MRERVGGIREKLSRLAAIVAIGTTAVAGCASVNAGPEERPVDSTTISSEANPNPEAESSYYDYAIFNADTGEWTTGQNGPGGFRYDSREGGIVSFCVEDPLYNGVLVSKWVKGSERPTSPDDAVFDSYQNNPCTDIPGMELPANGVVCIKNPERKDDMLMIIETEDPTAKQYAPSQGSKIEGNLPLGYDCDKHEVIKSVYDYFTY